MNIKRKLWTGLLTLCLVVNISTADAAEKEKAGGLGERTYKRIVVVSDLHYPAKFSAQKKPLRRAQTIYHKEKAVADINSWKDVDLVAFTGDMIARAGSEEAYKLASDFAMKIDKPKAFMTGNHEYLYSATIGKKNKAKRAKPEEREIEFARFKKYFKTPELYRTEKLGGYLLVFLSPDNIYAKYPTEMSNKEVQWFKETLEANKNTPTIAFFHGPLVGTLKSYTPKVNTSEYIAEPAKELDEIIMANPQLKLWVSGHTHTSPLNESFKHKLNWYKGRVLDVHNPSWEGKQIWTNSLYLYPEKIVIKTFDHKNQKFVESLTRFVRGNK